MNDPYNQDLEDACDELVAAMNGIEYAKIEYLQNGIITLDQADEIDRATSIISEGIKIISDLHEKIAH